MYVSSAFIVQTGFSILKKIFYTADGLLDTLKQYFIVQTENPKSGQNILNLYFITPPLPLNVCLDALTTFRYRIETRQRKHSE